MKIASAWQNGALGGFRTAVSLHSHTSYSRETLDFIPRFAAACPPVAAMLRRYEARYRRLHDRELNYNDAWWTPPLCPREALMVERAQIEGLGLAPLVSITDHDNIEAPLLLRVFSESHSTPIGLEWTVPWRGATFHIGIHNLAPRTARERAAEMARYTSCPDESRLAGLLEWITENEDTLVVFNHPYWDEKGHGAALHSTRAEQFLQVHGHSIHALELNGLRPWAENRRTIGLAEAHGLPVISGGDRHSHEPNALLNLTTAATFSEFVAEIREDRHSRVLVMRQYREPLVHRVLAAIADVMRDNRAHSHGWVRWSDRVFFRRANGVVTPLSALFRSGREPALIRLFVAGARLLDNRGLRAALRGLTETAPELTA